MEWVMYHNIGVIYITDIPEPCVDFEEEETIDRNREMYFTIYQSQKQLQLLVEHKLLVHKGVSKGYRQRKGGTLKIFSGSVTFLDGAARFLIGLCRGDRNTECWEFLSHSKKSLTSIYLLAASLREIIELSLIHI